MHGVPLAPPRGSAESCDPLHCQAKAAHKQNDVHRRSVIADITSSRRSRVVVTMHVPPEQSRAGKQLRIGKHTLGSCQCGYVRVLSSKTGRTR